MPPFIVLGLPRSRTAWLSRFLSYGDWHCGHEEARHWRSLEDVSAWFSQPCTGTAETALAPWWRLLDWYAPGARLVVVRRPVRDVIDSLMKIPGVGFDRSILEKIIWRGDRKLDQIERRVPNVLSVNFEDLAEENTCAAIFEHCLPYKHDPQHWAALAPINIQINMAALMRYWVANKPALDKLVSVARHRAIAEMAPREPVSPDGVTFQVETFDTWKREGHELFEEHCVRVGEAPGDWRCKNIPLMESLDAAGAMQIVTARCNGRMFGYLMTLISPSMTSPDVLSGYNTTFYASPDFPGLGLKLQRSALSKLKDRGVNEVFMQAGLRGSGERVASLYRRLGAENNGQLFRLSLAEH